MAVYQSLTLTQVGQNQADNTSQVRILWQSVQTGGSYNLTERTAYYTVSVNGQPENRVEICYVLPMQSTKVLTDTVITVPHNDKGEATVTVTTWMDTHISAGVVELHKTLVPEPIPRASILRAADGNIGGSTVLAVVKKNSAYSHSIFCKFGELWGYVTEKGQFSEREVIFSADQVIFQIPEAFFWQIPGAKNGQCHLYLQTYDGDVPVGLPHEAVFTATAEEVNCGPIITGRVVDVNEATMNLTGDSGVLVRFMSDALCSVETQTQYGAGIVETKIAGQTVQNGELLLPRMEQETVTFAVTDSRGYHAQAECHCPLIPYVKLSAEAAAKRESLGSNATVSVSGDCYCGSFGAKENTVTVEVSTDGVHYIPAEVTLGENRYSAFAEFPDVDYTRNHTIYVRVKDCLMQREKNLTLKKGVPVFDWGEQDFAFHVPVQMDQPLPLESGGTGARDALGARQQLGFSLPMEFGVEYATAELWNGQTVYTKLLEFGTMPNNAQKGVPHGADAVRMLRCFGSTSSGRTLPYGGNHVYRADIFCDLEKVYIDTEIDYSAYTAVVQIFYIK